jgi:sialate O-acetylesterase
MEAFTDDLKKIAIPTAASQAHFQTAVANLNVISNAKDVANGENLPGGNIEFWPNNYGPHNSANVAGASAQHFDFGDQPGEPVDGYGCMQIHNGGAKQTVIAVNQWKSGPQADLGIGNSPGDTRDWTFTRNAANYESARLRVLARMKQ